MRSIFTTVSGWIIIVLLALVIVAFVSWERLPNIVSNMLSKKMKVAVEIDDIALSKNEIEIVKLMISNPKGSILPHALTIENTTITAPLLGYFDQHIVIDEVLLNDVYLGLEFEKKGSSQGNWTTIMNNMQASSPEPAANDKNKRTVLIKRLEVRDIDIDLVYERPDGKVQHLSPIKKLVFTNVTSEGGIPSDQITKIILKETLKSIFSKENLENMVENFIQNPNGGVQNVLEPFKGLLNQYLDEIEPMESHGKSRI